APPRGGKQEKKRGCAPRRGKKAARADRRWRRKGRRHVEAHQGWLLHHVARRQAELLPPHDRRRQQVVGDEGNHVSRDLDEVRPAPRRVKGLLAPAPVTASDATSRRCGGT